MLHVIETFILVLCFGFSSQSEVTGEDVWIPDERFKNYLDRLMDERLSKQNHILQDYALKTEMLIDKVDQLEQAVATINHDNELLKKELKNMKHLFTKTYMNDNDDESATQETYQNEQNTITKNLTDLSTTSEEKLELQKPYLLFRNSSSKKIADRPSYHDFRRNLSERLPSFRSGIRRGTPSGK